MSGLVGGLQTANGGSIPSLPSNVEVTQLAERQPSKLKVAGSNPVFHSNIEIFKQVLSLNDLKNHTAIFIYKMDRNRFLFKF